MPTKTRKSSSKKSSAKAAAAAGESLSLASRVHFGPPFAAYGPFGGRWSRFPVTNPPPPPCPGFWAAFRHYPTTGGIVAQLGAGPTAGAIICSQYFYYQYDFTAQVAGNQTFILTLNTGPVTRLPRGGEVYAWGLLDIRGPGGHWAQVNGDLPSYSSASVAIFPNLQAGGRYTLTCGVGPIVRNVGYQSYCEIIVNSMSLDLYLPYGSQSAQALRSDTGVDTHTLTAMLNPSKKRVPQNTSMAEAIKMGIREG